jgi:type IV pilus assembly protein PilB
MERKKLGQLLIEAGVLTDGGLASALAEQKRWGGTLGKMLVEMKLVTEANLVSVLSRQLGIAGVDLDKLDIDASVLETVPGELALSYGIVPFALSPTALDIAMSDPTILGVLDELRIRVQRDVRPFLAGPKMIERAIAKYYGRRSQMRLSQRLAPIMGEIESRPARDAEIDALQTRLSELEANVARDEEVLRKLLALLVEKGVATRDEILDRIK